MTEAKTLSKKIVFQSRHFRVEEIVVTRDSKQFTKQLIERMPIVLVLPYTADGQIYLESQYRDAFERHCIEVIAGHIDPDEDPLAAAKRELAEETGLTAASWKKVASLELSTNMRAPIHIFFATDITEGKADLQDDEVIELLKMPLTEALEKITSGEIFATSHITTLLLFDKMKREGKL